MFCVNFIVAQSTSPVRQESSTFLRPKTPIEAVGVVMPCNIYCIKLHHMLS